MSSHREAPEISKDPVADSTDLYAFVSPDAPDTVTIIANYVPLETPAGGPNFYEFGDDVLYEINIDNDGDGRADVIYQFRFATEVRNDNTFLYNTGPITTLDDPDWNRRQFYTVTRVDGYGHKKVLGRHLACPPCNVGILSTPMYTDLANAAVHSLQGGRRVFAGQRADGFFVDLGSIFDLLNLRPFQQLNVFGNGLKMAPGVNALDHINVHSIAIQVPIRDLVKNKHHPTIGIYTSASRRQVSIIKDSPSGDIEAGPFVQVSRLGNPLFNEVIVPMVRKDEWNKEEPANDKNFAQFVAFPEVARLLPVIYPGVFPNLATLNGPPPTSRADLLAILLTGIPAGLIPGFQNFTGTTQADLLRLNTSIPPTPADKQSDLGVIGGDLAGFPNGRRPTDSVVTIELRAIAGLTFPLVNSDFTPDAAAGQITDGLSAADVSSPFLPHFPYLGVPYDGYNNPS
jgi:Domain of unknown function (DUF4331)